MLSVISHLTHYTTKLEKYDIWQLNKDWILAGAFDIIISRMKGGENVIMARIRITADATCDLPKELLKSLHINTIPLYVEFKGQTFLDGVNITPEEIFKDVLAGGRIPGTSAPSIGDYHDFFTKQKEDCDEIVHLSISSRISASYQSARLAAESMEGVYVVDSFALSSGTGLLVLKAAQMAEESKSAEEIANITTALRKNVRTSFLLDRLDFLYKGGRCSALQALGANLLRLKPCIEMPDGALALGAKFRGTLAKSLESYVESKLRGDAGHIDKTRIMITHSLLDDPSYIGLVESKIKEFADFDEVVISDASSVISAHCGPNTLGILYMVKSS